MGVSASPERRRQECVCVYLRLWRMSLPSVSSAAPPLSSEQPCIWSRTTTTAGRVPESVKSNLIRRRSSSFSLAAYGWMC